MRGKDKCRMLREIRQRIANENDIPFVTEECRHRGECTGTCPRCEAELRYLEEKLEERSSRGKQVAVAALCAGMAFTAAGCATLDTVVSAVQGGEQLSGMVEYTEPAPTPEVFVEMGEVAWPEDPAEDGGDDAVVELTGDIWYEPGEEADG